MQRSSKSTCQKAAGVLANRARDYWTFSEPDENFDGSWWFPLLIAYPSYEILPGADEPL